MATPKRQPYPASRIKVGTVLFRAYSLVDEGKVQTGFEEWVVRNIRARRNSKTVRGISLAAHGIEVPKVVNLTMKTSGTWGKLSSKTGDVGWLPNIWSGFRRQFQVGSDLPIGIYTTKRAALAFELANQNEEVEWLVGAIANETDEDELVSLKAELAEVSSMVAALQRRSKALAKI
ncbi:MULTISPECIES: hypothetical protein [Pseudomonas syringae group]|uniref:hypothetical protein n=1 Tax=Pseudomonas syringae group TaxID=136849 RepID=UPI0011C3915B|nr:MULTISPECIES: hypothetical protein [Pseudomonas syringae group]MDH4602376.1 hypothetical protein [Pseudomonas syringae pv. papulans]